MTTRAPAALVTLQNRIEDAIPSAVNAGIVGDAAHRLEASKHNSIEDNPRGSWAVTGAHDAAPPGTWSREFAAAFDVGLSRTDQNRVHNNLKKIFYDHTDPRRRYIAAFNGWDGQGSPGRYNLVTNTISVTDDSHKTHEHGETFYEYANDPKMADAWLSAVLGETKEQYLEVGFLAGLSDAQQQEALSILRKLNGVDWASTSRLLALIQGKPAVFTVPGEKTARNEGNAVASDLATVKANLQTLLGKDFVDEDVIADTVYAKLGGKTVDQILELLRGVLTPEQFAELIAKGSQTPPTA